MKYLSQALKLLGMTYQIILLTFYSISSPKSQLTKNRLKIS